MKPLIFAIAAVFLFLSSAHGFSRDDYSVYLPKLISMLQKGNPQEQKYALASLWFLGEETYRKDPAAYDPILAALADKNPSVREAAAGFLKSLGESTHGYCQATHIMPALTKIMHALIKALDDESPCVRAAAASAFHYYKYYKGEEAVAPLMKCLKDKDFLVRINAAFTLGELRAAETVTALLAAVDENSDWRNKILQQECLIALRKINKSDAHVAEVLINKFDDTYLKAEIIQTLGHFKVQEARELLIKATEDSDENIRTLALNALERLVRTETKRIEIAQPPPTPVMTDANGRKSYLAGGIAEFESGAGPHDKIETKVTDYEGRLDVLLKSLKDPSPEVRTTAVVALARIENAQFVQILFEMLDDPDRKVRIKVIEALAAVNDCKMLKELQYEKIFDTIIRDIAPGSSSEPLRTAYLIIAGKTADEIVKIEKKNGQREITRLEGYVAPYSGRALYVNPIAVTKLLPLTESQVQKMRNLAMYWLTSFEDPRIEGLCLQMLDDPSMSTRACSLLIRFGTKESVPRLISILNDNNKERRRYAAEALGAIQDERAREPLAAALHDESIQFFVACALGRLQDTRALAYLADVLKKDVSYQQERREASKILVFFENPAIVPILIKAIVDPDYEVAERAMFKLGAFKDEGAIPHLLKSIGRGDASSGRAKEYCGSFGTTCKKYAHFAHEALKQYYDSAEPGAFDLQKDPAVIGIIAKYTDDNDTEIQTGAKVFLEEFNKTRESRLKAAERRSKAQEKLLPGSYNN